MIKTQKVLKFHELELDQRIQKAVANLGWEQPTLIQSTAIPLLLEGKDVVVRARTGSGKTGTYAVPLIQKILNSKLTASEQCVSTLVLAPTKELCRQSRQAIEQIAEYCGKVIRVVDIGSSADNVATQRHALAERPDIVVTTPSKILAHAEAGVDVVDLKHIETLIVDEADLVFTYGYEKDFKSLLKFLPPIYQAVLVSATITDDVVSMKGLCLRNAVILKLEEPDIVSLEQLSHQRILAEENEKPTILYALLKLYLIQGKSIIFVNNVDRCYKIRLFLEQFGIRSCVLNSELPSDIRIHTINQFNRGTYDIIIASDEHLLKRPKNKSSNYDFESSASRGIDFQGVDNVINFDFPRDVSSYIHRAGRTARGTRKGSVLSFVSIKEQPINVAVEKKLRSCFGLETQQSISNPEYNIIKVYQFKMNEIQALRYRAQDCWRAASSVAVRDTRIREIKTEILNCQKLKGFFEANQRDLQALRHDKRSRTLKVQPHLTQMPEYILPKALKHVATSKPSTSSAAAAKQRRSVSSVARSTFRRKCEDPLMVSEVDYSKRRRPSKHK